MHAQNAAYFIFRSFFNESVAVWERLEARREPVSETFFSALNDTIDVLA